MNLSAIIILMFLMHQRGNIKLQYILIVGAFLYNIHPLAIIGVTLFFVLQARLRYPKGFVKKKRGVKLPEVSVLGSYYSEV